MTGWRLYVQGEAGEDLADHPLQGGAVVELGAVHQTPGLGIGRECRGFYNAVTVRGAEGERVLSTSGGYPLRLVLWAPGVDGREPLRRVVWLVAPSTPRAEVERLREVAWPWPG